MRIYMQTPVSDEGPPRYYQLLLQQDLLGGWTLVKEWGPQGARGKMVREHYLTLDAAENAFLEARDAQLRRGYRVMFAQGQEPPR